MSYTALLLPRTTPITLMLAKLSLIRSDILVLLASAFVDTHMASAGAVLFSFGTQAERNVPVNSCRHCTQFMQNGKAEIRTCRCDCCVRALNLYKKCSASVILPLHILSRFKP